MLSLQQIMEQDIVKLAALKLASDDRYGPRISPTLTSGLATGAGIGLGGGAALMAAHKYLQHAAPSRVVQPVAEKVTPAMMKSLLMALAADTALGVGSGVVASATSGAKDLAGRLARRYW